MTSSLQPTCGVYSIAIAYLANRPPSEWATNDIRFKLGVPSTICWTCPIDKQKRNHKITSFLEKVSENSTSERTQACTHKTKKQLCYGWWSTTQTETEHVTSSARRLPPKSMPANVWRKEFTELAATQRQMHKLG
jgi:hypothetical protein